jgi:hypothetical protein
MAQSHWFHSVVGLKSIYKNKSRGTEALLMITKEVEVALATGPKVCLSAPERALWRARKELSRLEETKRVRIVKLGLRCTTFANQAIPPSVLCQIAAVKQEHEHRSCARWRPSAGCPPCCCVQTEQAILLSPTMSSTAEVATSLLSDAADFLEQLAPFRSIALGNEWKHVPDSPRVEDRLE